MSIATVEGGNDPTTDPSTDPTKIFSGGAQSIAETAVASAIPPTPTAGSQVSQPQVPPKLPVLPTGSAPLQPSPGPVPALNPESPGFDMGSFHDHFSNVVQQYIASSGTWPTTGTAHDLTRSGLTLDAVDRVVQHLNANPPTPSRQMSPDEIPAVRGLSPDERDQISQKPFFVVQNASFQGIKWDAANQRFLVNENEAAPPQAMKHQLLLGIVDPSDALSVLNKLRSVNPGAIASVMQDIQQGNYAGALLKVGTDATSLTNLTAAEKDIIHTDANPHDASGTDRPWWAPITNVATALINEKKGELSRVAQSAAGVVAGAHEAAVSTAQGALGAAYTLSNGKSTPIDKAMAAASLVSSPFNFYPASTQDILQDEGVDHHVAKAAGAVVSLALMGPLGKANWVVKGIGAAATAVGTAAGYETSSENDIAGKVIDAMSGGAQAAQVSTNIGAAVQDALKVVLTARTMLAARNLATIEKANAGTIARLTAHVEAHRVLQDTATAATEEARTYKSLADPLSASPTKAPVGMGKGLAADALQAEVNKATGKTGRAAWADENGMIHYHDEATSREPAPTGVGSKGEFPETPRLTDARAARERADTPAARQVADIELRKAGAEALNKKTPTQQLTPVEARAKLVDQTKTVRSLISQINEATKTGKDVTTLKGLLAQTVREAHDHVYSGNDLGKSAAQGRAEADLKQAQANVHVADAIRQDTSFNQMTQEQAAALDHFTTAQNKVRAASSKSSFLTPIQKSLQNQHIKLAKDAAFKQAEADKIQELVSRATGGDVMSPIRQAGSRIIYHELGTGFDGADPNRLLASLSNAESAIKIHRDTMVAATKKLLGNDKAKIAQFEDAFDNPGVIPLIQDTKLLQAISDWRGFLADHALSVQDSFKGEIITNYFPRLTPIERAQFAKILGLETSVGKSPSVFHSSSSHLQERTAPEKTPVPGPKIHPADRLGSYVDSLANAVMNQHVRSVFKDSVDENHMPTYISYEDSPTGSLRPPAGLKMQKSSLPGLEGWVTSTAIDRLSNMANPDFYSSHNVIGEFNSLYKKGVMISPRHAWNQFAASTGVSVNSIDLLAKGHAITSNPALMDEFAKYSHAQGEKFMADAAERILENHPRLTPIFGFLKLTNAYNAFEHTLWVSYIRNLQAGMWSVMRDRYMSDGHDLDTASYAAGHMINEVTGISDPKMLNRAERTVQKYGLFSYIWNKKHVTIPLEAIPVLGRTIARKLDPALSTEQAKIVENMAQKYLIKYAMLATLLTEGANVALSGHTTMDNEPGHQTDLEWTGIHDAAFGSDGQRHYAASGIMMFGNFYMSKLQTLRDYPNFAEGVARNLANVTMPIPSWLTTTALTAHASGDLTRTLGTVFQQGNILQRNVFGPFEKEFGSGKPAATSPGQELAKVLSATSGVWLGLSQSQGPHTTFQQPDLALQNRAAVEKTLALEGISPYKATDAERAKAQQEVNSHTVAGVNWGELANEVAGKPIGTGSAYDLINKAFQAKMESDLLESGVTQAQIDAAKANKKSPLSVLSPTETKQFFNAHPEIEYGLQAASTNTDPMVQSQHDDIGKFHSNLHDKIAVDNGFQVQLDKEYTDGTITAYTWSQKSKDLRTKNQQAYEDLYSALTPAEQALVNKPPADSDPLLPMDMAWYRYHQIASGKYVGPDGTFDVKGYRAEQQAFLNALPSDQQLYIQNRDQQNQTDLEKKYFSASDAFAQFHSSNLTWEQQRSEYDSMPPLQRKIFLEVNPGLKDYFTFRQNYFRDNPQVAEFYHRTDQLQWNDWGSDKEQGTIKQAYAMADWYITAIGKHPEYISPWQTKAATDPAEFAKLTSTWTPDIYQQYQEAITAYYTQQAQAKTDFHNFLTSLRSRRQSAYGTGPSVLGG